MFNVRGELKTIEMVPAFGRPRKKSNSPDPQPKGWGEREVESVCPIDNLLPTTANRESPIVNHQLLIANAQSPIFNR
jgi:hypothetical protein